MKSLTVATRGGALAIAQTEYVIATLKKIHPGLEIRIKEITSVVETSVRKEIEAVKGGFDDYYKRFARDALKISKLLQNFKTQHESLLNGVVIYPRPKIETALLYSKDAVFDRLDDMLTERIKSNVTMVIPDPTDIPTKTLGKVKAQAKMTIVSKIFICQVISMSPGLVTVHGFLNTTE